MTSHPQPLAASGREEPDLGVFTGTGLGRLTVFIIVLFSILYPRSFRSGANFSAIPQPGVRRDSGGWHDDDARRRVFDLRSGALASMTGVITGWLMKNAGVPVPLAIIAGLAVAGLGGFLNGFIVAKVRVNALITTLGTMGIFKGSRF